MTVAACVRDGTETLTAAYEAVKADIADNASVEAKTAKLIAEAPDLAVLVREERMSIEVAVETLTARQAAAKARPPRSPKRRQRRSP